MEEICGLNVLKVNPAGTTAGTGKSQKASDVSFNKVLQNELQSGKALSFSSHARKRMEVRNIHLNQEQMERLNEGIIQAEEKGARESLVLLENLAFIVSIENRTVVTAMDGDRSNKGIFTQIDSTVIV